MATAKSSHHDDDAHGNDHPFHLVDPSPWPLLASIGFLILAGSTAFYFHDKPHAGYGILGGLGLLFYVGYRWWKDCVNEGRAHHTKQVRNGLRAGMALFILSEVMFFFAFFFSFFHSAVSPSDWVLLVVIVTLLFAITSAGVIGALNNNKLVFIGSAVLLTLLVAAMALFVGLDRGNFPPADMEVISAWELPLFNTLLLLLSGTTVTWAHAALLENNRRDLIRGLAATVALGILFTIVQAYEYHHAFEHYFKFPDNNYSANFYMATGFHGLHVIIGTIFLIVCLIRAVKGQMDEEHHLGFEFAAWYWHFVDVVWLFLFTFVYVWAGWNHG